MLHFEKLSFCSSVNLRRFKSGSDILIQRSNLKHFKCFPEASATVTIEWQDPRRDIAIIPCSN